MPGDAFTSLLLNPQLPPDAYEKTIALYGLDKPLSERVIKYVQNFFKGDFGFSYRYWTNLDGEQDAKMPERSAGTNSMIDPDEFGAVEKSIARNQPAVVSLQSGQSGPGIPDTSLEA